MERIKRFLILGITVIVSYLLQFVFLPWIPHLVAVPNLLLVSVITFGLLYGRTIGMVMGFICGALMDLLGTGTPGFYGFILTLSGYLNGVLSEKMESEMILILTLVFLANSVIYHFYGWAFGFLIERTMNFRVYFSKVFMPETSLSVIAFIIIYGILGYFSKRWNLKIQHGDVKVV